MTTIEAMKQALAAGERFIMKVHTGKAKSTETYDDLTASNRSLREAIKREEAQTVELIASSEREALVARLRVWGENTYTHTMFQEAADMLAADAQAVKSVTCQIYGHVVGACGECNTHADSDVNATNAVLATRYFELLEKMEAQQVAVPHGWMIDGSSHLLRGEFAEADAKSEAKRCGGTCKAYPVYTKLPHVSELTDDDINSVIKEQWGRPLSFGIPEVAHRAFARAILAAQKAKQ